MPRSIDRLSPDICAQTAQFAIQVLISSINMIDIMNFRDAISDQSGNDQRCAAAKVRRGHFRSAQPAGPVDKTARHHHIDVRPHLVELCAMFEPLRIDGLGDDGLTLRLRQQSGQRLLDIGGKARIRLDRKSVV